MRRLAIALGIACALPAQGANRYVAPEGSDQNDCSQTRPCKSVQAGIDRMANGDTLIIADGVYSTNTTVASACTHSPATQVYIRGKNCASGCTIRAANVDAVNPRVVLNGGHAAFCVADSTGWTIEGIRFDAPAGAYANRVSNLTVRDSIVEFSQEPQRTYYGIYLSRVDHVTLSSVQIYDRDRPCWVRSIGADTDGHRGFFIKDATDLTIEDSYIGFSSNLGNYSNVVGATVRRTHFQHWAEHGFVIGQGSKDLLFENVIWGGTTWGHCWNGADQGSLTATRCRSNAECGGEPGGANVCRIDDCFCSGARDRDPPNCGTCTAGPTDDWDTCWRGPRTLDLYEVDGLVVRNNNFVGHGYMPISAIYRNFTAQNASANCTTYPGVCELDPSRACTEAQGNAFCATAGPGGSDLGRCIPICEVKGYKFYNNLVYDMMTQDQIKDPSYLRVPTENDWNRHSGFRIDGNLYSGGQKSWFGCDGWPTYQLQAARFGPGDSGRCWTGSLSGFTDQSCTKNSDCTTGLCNNTQWQGALCYGQPVDLNGHWYADIESAFVSYFLEDYRPASRTAPMVNAGVSGVDPEGVAMCAPNDFHGIGRVDGQCDAGAFEFSGDTPAEPPPPVSNLQRDDDGSE